MATPTYTALASTTLGGSASSVTFSSIDQSYGDLVLVWDLDADSSAGGPRLTFNSDSGSNYSWVRMNGDGSSATSNSSSGTDFPAYNSAYDKFWGYMHLMDYVATDKHKTLLVRQNNVGEFVTAIAARYASTSAITSIQIDNNSGNFTAGSTFSLYGIAK